MLPYLFQQESGTSLPVQIGNKTECALLGFVLDLGVDYRQVHFHHLFFFDILRLDCFLTFLNKKNFQFMLSLVEVNQAI